MGVTKEGSDGRGEEGEAVVLGMVKGFGDQCLEALGSDSIKKLTKKRGNCK